MRLMVNVDEKVHRQLELLARMRKSDPTRVAESLLGGLADKATSTTKADLGNLHEIMEVLAARLKLVDQGGDAVRQTLTELSMLDDTPQRQVAISVIRQAMGGSGTRQHT